MAYDLRTFKLLVKGFYTAKEAEEWMDEPSRKKRRLDRQIQDSEAKKQEPEIDLEADVKALNEKHALENTADVEINDDEINDGEINDDDIYALSKAYGALKMGGNMNVTKQRSGPDISVTPLTPPLSPSASSPSTPPSSSSSSSAGDTLPSSPASAASVKRTSATPSR